MSIENTDFLPLRVRMYWQGPQAVAPSIVGDMYVTKVLAYTMLHAWIDGAFIKQGVHGLTLGDCTRVACGTLDRYAGGYSDETGAASYVIERGVS